MEGYYTHKELESMGFKRIGREVLVSKKASFYGISNIEIGDNVRIDDFCIFSGRIVIGSHIHIASSVLIGGGSMGVFMGDFISISHGVKIFASSDDYSGESMANSVIPAKYKNVRNEKLEFGDFSHIGANSVILPSSKGMEQGVALGAMSLLLRKTKPWGMYFGIPARRVSERSKICVELKEKFLQEWAGKMRQVESVMCHVKHCETSTKFCHVEPTGETSTPTNLESSHAESSNTKIPYGGGELKSLKTTIHCLDSAFFDKRGNAKFSSCYVELCHVKRSETSMPFCHVEQGETSTPCNMDTSLNAQYDKNICHVEHCETSTLTNLGGVA